MRGRLVPAPKGREADACRPCVGGRRRRRHHRLAPTHTGTAQRAEGSCPRPFALPSAPMRTGGLVATLQSALRRHQTARDGMRMYGAWVAALHQPGGPQSGLEAHQTTFALLKGIVCHCPHPTAHLARVCACAAYTHPSRIRTRPYVRAPARAPAYAHHIGTREWVYKRTTVRCAREMRIVLAHFVPM